LFLTDFLSGPRRLRAGAFRTCIAGLEDMTQAAHAHHARAHDL
jgi:hypothetical protein